MVMKKIILAIALTAGFISGAFAEDDSSSMHINNTLHLFFNITDNHRLVNANNYLQTTILYNGMPVTAFKNKISGWYGFFKKLSADDLPANAVSLIKNRYKNSTIINATLYFNNEANLTYFAEIMVNNKCTVLEIQPSGSIKVFS